MRPRQRPAAIISVLDHHARPKLLNWSPDLHVPELADVEMPAVPGLQPAEEDVARRLHQAAAVHDPLPVIRVDALTGVRLQHRGARLLDLEKQGILSAGHHEHHAAQGADAADPDHLERGIREIKTVEEHPSVFRQ